MYINKPSVTKIEAADRVNLLHSTSCRFEQYKSSKRGQMLVSFPRQGFFQSWKTWKTWKMVQHHGKPGKPGKWSNIMENLENSWNLVFQNTKSWKFHGKSI